VVRSESGDEQLRDEADRASAAQDDRTARAQQHPAFTLTGADLAIVTDVDVLLRSGGSPVFGVGIQVAAYGLGLLAMILAFVARSRAMADPAEVARNKALQEQRAAVAGAATITEASDALRRMIATADTRPPTQLDAFLAECDDYAYAPGGASRALDERQRSRALQLADSLLRGKTS
jgi:hypothetical protein